MTLGLISFVIWSKMSVYFFFSHFNLHGLKTMHEMPCHGSELLIDRGSKYLFWSRDCKNIKDQSWRSRNISQFSRAWYCIVFNMFFFYFFKQQFHLAHFWIISVILNHCDFLSVTVLQLLELPEFIDIHFESSYLVL